MEIQQASSKRFFGLSTTSNGMVRVIITDADRKAVEDLFQKTSGGRIAEELPLINGYLAEVNPSALKDIFKRAPEDMNIVLDQKVTFIRPPEMNSSDGEIRPKLDTAMPTLGMEKVWEKGFTGKGVSIAVIDTGIFPHEDLQGRIIAFKDIVNGKDNEPYDDQGHGTHVSGDATGTGKASGGKYKGPAFGASLVGVKVLDGSGSGTFSDVIKGIQWATDNKDKYNIRVISMSLGGYAWRPWDKDPVALAVEKAYEKGIVPVIAAGNEGPSRGTIATPGIAPHAVTIGALDDRGTVDRSDDRMANFTSRGPTNDGIVKPNVASPGVKITAPNAPGSELDKWPGIPHTPDGKYITISGTSMATPIVSGIVATWLQANPKLTPAEVAAIIAATSDPLPNYDENTQGKGVINPSKGLEVALSKLSPSPLRPEPVERMRSTEPQPLKEAGKQDALLSGALKGALKGHVVAT